MLHASLAFLAVVSLTVSMLGCGNVGFDVSQDIPATMIVGDPNQTLLAGQSEQPLTLDIMAETQMRNSGPASGAYLRELTFTITQPQSGTFYFVREVHIYLVPQNPASVLPSIEIATLNPVYNANTIKIVPIPNINILPYSNEGANITATATGQFPREDTTYVGHVVVEVRI